MNPEAIRNWAIINDVDPDAFMQWLMSNNINPDSVEAIAAAVQQFKQQTGAGATPTATATAGARLGATATPAPGRAGPSPLDVLAGLQARAGASMTKEPPPAVTAAAPLRFDRWWQEEPAASAPAAPAPAPTTPAATTAPSSGQQAVANTAAATVAAGATLPFAGKWTQTANFGDKGPWWEKTGGAHQGNDYGLPSGTDVLSMDDGGEVKVAGEDHGDGYGTKVIVHYAWGDVILAHLTPGSVAVKRGDLVKRGQVLGKSGQSGNSTGPHLHVEVRAGGKAVDPKTVMSGAATTPVATKYSETAAATERVDGPPQVVSNNATEAEIRESGMGDPRTASSDPPRLAMGNTGLVPGSGAVPSAQNGVPQGTRPFNGLGIKDMTPGEGEYYYPFSDPKRGGTDQAAYNILSGMGVSPDSGNPYASFLEDQIPTLYETNALERMLSGKSIEPSDVGINKEIAGDVTDLLRRGQVTGISNLNDTIGRLVGLGKAGVAKDDKGPLSALLEMMNAGGGQGTVDVLGTAIGPNMHPLFRPYLMKALKRKLMQFRQSAPENVNMPPIEYLARGYGSY